MLIMARKELLLKAREKRDETIPTFKAWKQLRAMKSLSNDYDTLQAFISASETGEDSVDKAERLSKEAKTACQSSQGIQQQMIEALHNEVTELLDTAENNAFTESRIQTMS